MSLTNPDKVVTEERLNEYHQKILPYLGGNSMVACGGGYAPIGTVISYMGTRAPSDFLICDGTVYNIADYTELADFFEAQFGSSNFFGGDGSTTFAVPDLRGEFLRGTGTNSHANQGSGANVGVHQDGTEIPSLSAFDEPYKSMEIATGRVSKEDSKISTGQERYVSNTYQNTDSAYGLFTSRPTNTSVLYCIKAKSQGNGYSLDEQIVGTWIDGKPIYQKTVDCGIQSTGSTTIEVAHNVSNIGAIKFVYEAFIVDETNNDSNLLPVVNISASDMIGRIGITNSNITLKQAGGWSSWRAYITIRYTKTTD